MNTFETNNREIVRLLKEWEPKLLTLSEETIGNKRNTQNRSIKQIVGHMVDSASNNTHRIVHLQYQPNPLIFPDYANLGNNDRWIVIQNYQAEDWEDLVQLWKYSNIHLVHVIRNVNPEKLENEWISAQNKKISLKSMILDYLRHLQLHLLEIEELLNQ